MMVSPGTGPEPRRTPVGLFADQYLVGQAVRTALSTRGFPVANYRWPAGSRQVREAAHHLVQIEAAVGVLLCDLDKPERLPEVAELVNAAGSVRWLLLTNAPESPRWGAVLVRGITAVLPTSTGLDDLVVAVSAAAAGGSVMDETVRRRLVREWRLVEDEERRLVARMESLTARELNVLSLLYDGKSVRGIAELAGVSEATVRSQVKAVLRKLEVNSQLAAVAAYRRAKDVSRTRREV
ncbi:hypothetical protein GCM10009844_42120 [Nocardioides koreensis]|jgi:DNA-binding NarL/FixJ family response regulator|uniref:HTH luxR-type domain-containing protein n=1 Tax=Nocardioides koreensis TaxID=433651 RepID=A0ABN3A6W2_9ACTN